MPTSPVTATVSGASFSVNVTAASLDPVLSIRDFLVLENGTLTINPNSYTKNTATSITYAGPSLAANTNLEIRRYTPRNIRTVVTPNTKVRATDWNLEFDRRVRIQEELDLYGAGGGFSVRLPLNDAYGITWATDVLFPPTRQALYNKIELLASKASPVFTGVVTVPTPATADNSTTAASTAYVKSNLGGLAPIASPALTGSPTAPTPSTSDNSTLLSTTAYVKNNLTSYATLSSPSFTGTPLAPTTAGGQNNTQVVNARALLTRSRPIVIARRVAALSLTINTWTDITYDTIITDTSGTFNGTTFTAPYTGVYEFAGLVAVGSASTLAFSLCSTTGTELVRLGACFMPSAGVIGTNGKVLELMNAGETRKFMVQANGTTTTFGDTGRNTCCMSINYLGIATAS